MQVINNVIFNRLASHESVVLPGFGTISLARGEAELSVSGSLIPPVNRLLFSTNESSSETIIDIILADSELDRGDLEYAYNRWISDIKSNSAQNNYYIDGVCSITMNADEGYEIEASLELDNLLNPFKQVNLHVAKLKQAKKSNKGYAGVIIWSIIGLITIAIAAWSYFREVLPPPVVVPVIEDTLIFADTTSLIDTVSIDTIGIEDDDTVVAEDVIEQQLISQTKHAEGDTYHIIVGVFSTDTNARKFIAKESGKSASDCEVIPTSKGLYMVSIKRLYNKEEANNELMLIEAKFHNAWIFKKNN